MHRIIFAIGSNLGDRESFLNNSITKLTQNLDLINTKTSTILQNKALLLEGSPKSWDIDFFNIAFSADIDLKKHKPLDILKEIKSIEKNMGRIDRGRWSPREIDIDILAIDDLIVDHPGILQIPHQELFNRDFFMSKFIEIEPDIFNKLNKHGTRRSA
jgi:2-amino-4-hydroxy-6-hydroxymethyldihydropteridine diphosphokinase/dihydropteroate synthase